MSKMSNFLNMEDGSRAKVHNLDVGEDITNWAIFTAAGQIHVDRQ